LDILNPLGWAERVVSDAIGTVICTELYNQGEISEKDLKWAAVYRKKYVSDKAYKGYLGWAMPITRLMKKKGLFNNIFKPVAKALVNQWINIAKEKQGTMKEKAIHTIAYIFSMLIYYYKRPALIKRLRRTVSCQN